MNRALKMDRTTALSVVAPCFNEQETLSAFHGRMSVVCRKQCGDDYEIVLVDDGSSDGTWSLMEQLASSDPHVVAVRLSRNHGHQLALTAGLDVCVGRRILIIDADLQDPPELLEGMWELMDRGAHVVYGQRMRRRGETRFKRASAAVFYHLMRRLVDFDVPLDTGDFRLISRKALDLLRQMPERHRFVRGLVAWIGLEQTPIAYERAERFAGSSHYPLRKMFLLAFDAITGFSIKPLKLATYFGLFFAFISVLGIGHTIYSFLFLDTVSGWASVMTALFLLGSVQLIVLGVIGEYLGRMFLEVKRRPLFIIDKIATQNAEREKLAAARAVAALKQSTDSLV